MHQHAAPAGIRPGEGRLAGPEARALREMVPEVGTVQLQHRRPGGEDVGLGPEDRAVPGFRFKYHEAADDTRIETEGEGLG